MGIWSTVSLQDDEVKRINNTLTTTFPCSSIKISTGIMDNFPNDKVRGKYPFRVACMKVNGVSFKVVDNIPPESYPLEEFEPSRIYRMTCLLNSDLDLLRVLLVRDTIVMIRRQQW